jgi:hypothetical protein
MKQEFLSHAIARLLRVDRSAHVILGELDACMSTRFSGVEEFETQRRADLSSNLEVLGRELPVLLDLMGMNNTRESFLGSWKTVVADLSVTEAIVDSSNSDVYLISRPLQLVGDILRVIGAGSRGVLGEDSANIKTLEYILRSTPQILKARGIVPKKESEIQRALHEHLESTFPDYSRGVKLPHGLKSFVPDGAIRSLGVLIEVKFVNSERKVAQIFSGIVEDLSGYGGLRDWTRYYSVVYQTEPFVNEVRFDRSLRLSGNAGSWKPIVVVGPGGRSRASTRSSAQ